MSNVSCQIWSRFLLITTPFLALGKSLIKRHPLKKQGERKEMACMHTLLIFITIFRYMWQGCATYLIGSSSPNRHRMLRHHETHILGCTAWATKYHRASGGGGKKLAHIWKFSLLVVNWICQTRIFSLFFTYLVQIVNN